MPSSIKGLRDSSIPEKKVQGRKKGSRAPSIDQVAAASEAAMSNAITAAVPGVAQHVPYYYDAQSIYPSSHLYEASNGMGVGVSGSSVVAKLHAKQTASTQPALKGENTFGGKAVAADSAVAAGSGDGFGNTLTNTGTGGGLLVDGGSSASRTVPALEARANSGTAAAILCNGGEQRRVRRVTGTFGINENDNVIVVYVVSGTGAITGTFAFSPSAALVGWRCRVIDGGNFAATRNIIVSGVATGQFSDGTNTKTLSAAGQVFDIEVIETASGTYKFHAVRLARA